MSRVVYFTCEVMSRCWCLVWCTLARCCTGAPDTTTSSSPTFGARDTSGVPDHKTKINNLIIKVRRKRADHDNGYSWFNHWGKQTDLQRWMIYLWKIRVRREGDARQSQQLRQRPQQQQRPWLQRRSPQQQRSHCLTPSTTWWSRVWVDIYNFWENKNWQLLPECCVPHPS